MEDKKQEIININNDATTYRILPSEYDSWLSVINNIPLATHMYYIDDTLYGAGGKCFKPFTHSGMVINLLYMPFLEKDDLLLYKIPYDQKRLGSVSDSSESPEDGVDVYKIYNFQPPDKTLANIAKYPPTISERSAYKSWKNESKFYQYPYHYITINDYINSPLMLIPKFIEGTTAPVKVSQPISMTGGYTVYIPGYKGDKKGSLEGLFSASGLDLPTSSTAYSQFMSTNKNTFQAEQSINERNAHNKVGNSIINSLLPGIVTAAGIALAPATGGTSAIVGKAIGAGVAVAGANMVSNTVNDALTAKQELNNNIQKSQAKISDILDAPRNVSMSSGDILMTLDRNNKQLVYNRYMITQYYRDKILDYWTLYGYKQNKLMNNTNNKLITSRKYFNYIKTIDANIIGNNLDKSELEQIKAIYDSGVRFWHYFDLQQKGLKMFDYHMDNVER